MLQFDSRFERDPQAAANVIKRGGLVAIPTETVYGLAANALDPVAVARIFAAKDRPFFDPLIVHLADVSWWPRVASQFPAQAQRLAERFWPGPLTLVLPKSESVPELVTSGLSDVAVRVPDHPLAREMIRLADLPVAAPSANPFGRLSPTTAEHVWQQLGDRIDMILDGGPCRVGVESTIIRFHGSCPVCLRPGGVPLEEIEELIGPVERFHPESPSKRDHSESERPLAPGMLESHYAPRTRLIVVDSLPDTNSALRTGLLTLKPDGIDNRFTCVEVLSRDGDLVKAASNFFQALHRLDARNLDVIFAFSFPDHGLGRALNDRLKRAAHQ